MGLVECVPNFSEGRRPEVIGQIRDAIAAVPGVVILDVSSDASHNRSVVTFVVPSESAVQAAFAGIATAARLIDLTAHQGQHPRIGATDVCPFVPLQGTTMQECVALAHELGRQVGESLAIPVFLYERAATRPDRINLADVRRGEFEGAREQIGVDAAREPDFGPHVIHPTAGATVIGARPFLVAFNVYLGGAEHLAVAKEVAKAVRESSGGLPRVKALGLEVDGQAQVSMNLVDTDEMPLSRVYAAVRREAEARGVGPTRSELVGLVPESVLFEVAATHLGLEAFSPSRVLEHEVRAAQGPALSRFVTDVAGSAPVPGGGSVSALAGQLAAALTQMVAGLTRGRPRYADVEDEMAGIADEGARLGALLGELVERDADSFTAVSAAYRRAKDDVERPSAIQAALVGAAEVPLETARACADVARLAVRCALHGNVNTISDAGVAALLADAGCRGAAYNVRINVASMADPGAGTALLAATTEVVADARAASDEAIAHVERAIS